MNKIILFTLAIIFSIYTFADGIKFTASSTNVVTVGENFRLTFELNAKGNNFNAPAMKNFAVLSGPSTSTSTSMSFVNGQRTSSVSYTFTYILRANKSGKFTIPAASINVKGKKYKSNSVNIEVVGSKQQQATKQQNKQQDGKVNNKDLFVKVNVNKSTLYQGEHLVATVKVYTRVSLSNFEDMKFPSFSGFWTQEIETPSQISLKRENINGTIYNVGVIKKSVLYPQKSGKIIIDPFELTCNVRQEVKQKRRRSVFDNFFGSYQNIKVKAKSQPVTINVKPLPGKKPKNFDGAVGKFNMIASIDKNTAKTNDAITLKIKISGNGNLKLIDPMEIDFPADFEVYDPKINNNIKTTVNGSSGSKMIEYLMIPRHSGDFTIAPLTFSYFNTATKKYQTIASKEFNIHIEKGEGDNDISVVSNFSKEDVRFIGKDIRFIKTQTNLHKKGFVFFGSLKFYLSYIIPMLLFLILIIISKKRIKANSNQLLVKNKKANKISKKRLKLAEVHLKANNKDLFYTEVLNALWGYLSDKLSIPVSNLSRESTIQNLEKHNIDKEIIDKFLQIIDSCEFAHFSPSNDASMLDKSYKEASDIIGKLESKL